MSPTKPSQSEAIREVIRGERPWTDLQEHGINIDLKGKQCKFENKSQIVGRADIHDIARGFLAHINDAKALRDWAFVVEAMDVDLDVEDHPDGEVVLEALWDASFGKPISASTVGTLEKLARTTGSHV